MNQHDGYILYISSHGAVDHSLPSEPVYICGTNFQKDYMERDGLRVSMLLDRVQALPTRHKAVIMNICFAGQGVLGTDMIDLEKANKPEKIKNNVLSLTVTFDPFVRMSIDRSFEYIGSTGAEASGFTEGRSDIFQKILIEVFENMARERGHFMMDLAWSALFDRVTSETGDKPNGLPETMVPVHRKFGSGSLIAIAKKKTKIILPSFDTTATKYLFWEDKGQSQLGIGVTLEKLLNNWKEEGFGDLRTISFTFKLRGPLYIKRLYELPAPQNHTGIKGALNLLVRRCIGAISFFKNKDNRAKCKASPTYALSVGLFLSSLTETLLGCWVLKDENLDPLKALDKIPLPDKILKKIAANWATFQQIDTAQKKVSEMDVNSDSFILLESTFAWSRLSTAGLGVGFRLIHLVQEGCRTVSKFPNLTSFPEAFFTTIETYGELQYPKASSGFVRLLQSLASKLPTSTREQIAHKLRTLPDFMTSLRDLGSIYGELKPPLAAVCIPPLPSQGDATVAPEKTTGKIKPEGLPPSDAVPMTEQGSTQSNTQEPSGDPQPPPPPPPTTTANSTKPIKPPPAKLKGRKKKGDDYEEAPRRAPRVSKTVSEEPPKRISTRTIKSFTHPHEIDEGAEEDMHLIDLFRLRFAGVPAEISAKTIESPAMMKKCTELKSVWFAWIQKIQGELEYPSTIANGASNDQLILFLKGQFVEKWEWILVGLIHSTLCSSDVAINKILNNWIALGFIFFRMMWKLHPSKKEFSAIPILLGSDDFEEKGIKSKGIPIFFKLRKLHCVINNFLEGVAQGSYLKGLNTDEKARQQRFLRELELPEISL